MMNSLNRIVKSINRSTVNPIPSVSSVSLRILRARFDYISTKSGNGDDEWNDAWESSWLPEDLTEKNGAPWETDVNFLSTATESKAVIASEEVDAETGAFVEDMNEHWSEKRGVTGKSGKEAKARKENAGGESLYSLESMKKDYRLKKQRIHAALWVKEIEKQEEAKLGDPGIGGGDCIDRLLDSCSEIFDSVNHDFDNLEVPSVSELKNKPDGWEATAKEQDGNMWEMSQREEVFSSENLIAELRSANFR